MVLKILIKKRFVFACWQHFFTGDVLWNAFQLFLPHLAKDSFSSRSQRSEKQKSVPVPATCSGPLDTGVSLLSVYLSLGFWSSALFCSPTTSLALFSQFFAQLFFSTYINLRLCLTPWSPFHTAFFYHFLTSPCTFFASLPSPQLSPHFCPFLSSSFLSSSPPLPPFLSQPSSFLLFLFFYSPFPSSTLSSPYLLFPPLQLKSTFWPWILCSTLSFPWYLCIFLSVIDFCLLLLSVWTQTWVL